MKALTPTMQHALDLAKRHDGKLYRFRGGYWSHKDWRTGDKEGHCGTLTVEALIRRGAVKVTQTATAFGDTYPVEVTIV